MDRCRCCGFPIPDGRHLCSVCDGTAPNPDAILKDGTRLYLKTPIKPCSEQLRLYQELLKGENNDT